MCVRRRKADEYERRKEGGDETKCIHNTQTERENINNLDIVVTAYDTVCYCCFYMLVLLLLNYYNRPFSHVSCCCEMGIVSAQTIAVYMTNTVVDPFSTRFMCEWFIYTNHQHILTIKFRFTWNAVSLTSSLWLSYRQFQYARPFFYGIGWKKKFLGSYLLFYHFLCVSIYRSQASYENNNSNKSQKMNFTYSKIQQFLDLLQEVHRSKKCFVSFRATMCSFVCLFCWATKVNCIQRIQAR